MLAFGYINNKEEWDKIQMVFMQKHHYFTPTAIKNNYYQKEKNLAIVQSKIK